MDNDNRGEDLTRATEGAVLTEEQAKELSKPDEIDYPMPGEVIDDHGMSHHMPTPEPEFIDEKGNEA